jgi:hypothetical protein
VKAPNIFEGIDKAARAGHARGLSGEQPDAVADDCELHRLPYAVAYSQGRIVFLNKRDHLRRSRDTSAANRSRATRVR